MSDFVCPEGARLIPLSGVCGAGRFAIVDAKDYERLAIHRWHVARDYPCRSARVDRKRMVVFLHHEILGKTPDFVTDHINGNCLDNRRSNLRLATPVENMRNRKVSKSNKIGLKGVYKAKRQGKPMYRAQIKCNGKNYSLGSFTTPEEAHQAYKEASAKLHGAFSRTE